jgi:hypothetical protein
LGSVRVFSGGEFVAGARRANISWADLATAMEARFIFVRIAGNAHRNGDTAAKHLALDHVRRLLAVDKTKAPSMRRQIVTPNDQMPSMLQ